MKCPDAAEVNAAFDREVEAARAKHGVPDDACTIILPFPPASLSGHNKGNWWAKAEVVADHRERAFNAALAANITVPADGDIRLHVRFIPPDNRGDRMNFWNRIKQHGDGIAEALGVNDKRFLPSMEFLPPCQPGWVEFVLW